MDTLKTAIKLSYRSLMAYKIRSFLTMLGIIIGISAVIVMISIANGADAKIQAQFDNMGSNLLFILSGSDRSGGVRRGVGSQLTLTVKDAEAILRDCSAISAVSYLVSQNAQIESEKENWNARVQGTTPEYKLIRNLSLESGEFLNATHLRRGAKVAVLGKTVVDSLFIPGEVVIGKRVRINNIPYRVIGVLNKKGMSAGGQDQDDIVYIPYLTAMQKLIRYRIPGLVHAITVSAKSRDDIFRAKLQIEEVLRHRHGILPNAEDDFSCRSLEELSERAQDAGHTMTYFLVAVAAVSLIIGGIGIMNIMLVSVTERTREIGIRVAVGAKEADILVQFLIEAVTMSLVGGCIGTLLGILLSHLISQIAQWPAIISIQSIFFAIFSSSAIGIFFGFYPAKRASRLDPIKALGFD